ncbi:VOC family protein [Cohnella sp. REN36]|uniref:VOC family protein n=1 Tax=Cohnella sp. REN36 TaxID=2887347 RepID=UPI001D15A76D|nr:VOC family protein [Cohnella sp. REN36]MCC3376594.1 VOC family protein [Cohnella sp. REN36]
MGKPISSSLAVLTVANLPQSQQYYRDVLGFDVTDWWAERDGLQGLALKLHQAPAGFVPQPNPPQPGDDVGIDVQAYVTDWAALDALYAEFRAKGAHIAREPVVYADGGPWKEFVVADPDGYHLAFGGVDGGRAHSSFDPHIDAAILWVRDLNAAVARYSRLLGIEARERDRYGQLHLFRLDNGTHLMLDSHGMAEVPVQANAAPTLKIGATDIDRAREEAVRLGFEVVYGIQRLGPVSYFNIRDIDGNVITISQEHPE